MNIAIFGSCVSRDACEFIPNSNVVEYVARHSVVSLERPHGKNGIDLSNLKSQFQMRMVNSDLEGTGVERIVRNADDLDLVLVDLVDERRGYWLFSNGTTMTNSIEIEASGASEMATAEGARLVNFGTNEHFEKWVRGFNTLTSALNAAGVGKKTVFLDIEWAGAMEGAQYPKKSMIGRWGRRLRRAQRGIREALRHLSNGCGVTEAWWSLRQVKPTEAEQFADRAQQSNMLYVRYRRVARSLMSHVVTRPSSELRIGRGHKWGAEPFHYRNRDYMSIVNDVTTQLKKARR